MNILYGILIGGFLLTYIASIIYVEYIEADDDCDTLMI